MTIFRKRGHNVFFDIKGMTPGNFETTLLHQIATRDNFLILLAPGTLDRCNEPSDWLRREIEHAIATGRNVIPILFENFEFNREREKLPDSLLRLEKYAGIKLVHEYFEAGMKTLDQQYLIVPDPTNLTSSSPTSTELAIVAEVQATANAFPDVTAEELTAEHFLTQSYEHINTGNFEAALHAANEAIRLNNRFAPAYNNRGIAHAVVGQFDIAMADFDTALSLDPKLITVFYNRGFALAGRGEYEKAIVEFTNAISFDPTFVEAYFQRGRSYDALAKNDLTLADYNQAIKLNPKYSVAYVNRGILYGQMGDLDQAMKDFNEAIQIDRNLAPAYANRAIVHAIKRELDQAIIDFTESIRLDPTDPLTYNNRSNAYKDIGELELAISDLSTVLSLYPNIATVYRKRAYLYRQLDRFAESEADEREASRLEVETNLD